MNQEETNNMLRQIVIELAENGWPKSYIGKILLGTNGQAHLSQWIKKDEKENNYKNFGIKPLSKIGDLLNYELHLCFLPKTAHDENNELIQEKNQEAEDYIKELNQVFQQDLLDNMKTYLQDSLELNGKQGSLDDILNEIVENE